MDLGTESRPFLGASPSLSTLHRCVKKNDINDRIRDGLSSGRASWASRAVSFRLDRQQLDIDDIDRTSARVLRSARRITKTAGVVSNLVGSVR